MREQKEEKSEAESSCWLEVTDFVWVCSEGGEQDVLGNDKIVLVAAINCLLTG